jgi:hypothetical protein
MILFSVFCFTSLVQAFVCDTVYFAVLYFFVQIIFRDTPVCFTLFSVSYRFLNSVCLSLHYDTLTFLATVASSLLFHPALKSLFISCRRSVLQFVISIKTCPLTEVTRACTDGKEETSISELSLEEFNFKAVVKRSLLQPSLSLQLASLVFVN